MTVSLCEYIEATGLIVGSPGSMRAAVGDSLSVNGIASQLADWYGWRLNITAKGGDAAADQANCAFRFSPAQGDIFTCWTGTNDNFLCGTDSNKKSVSQSAHLSMLLQLATKEGSNKVRAASMTATGTWASGAADTDVLARNSSTNGSTLSCSVTGTTVALVGWQAASFTGQFSVTIDGVNKGTFSSAIPGGAVPSNQGKPFAPFAQLFTGLSNAAHTVVIAVTSATGASAVVDISFVAGYGSTINSSDPLVVTANIYDLGSTGNTLNGTTSANIAAYSALISANVTTARGIGLNVKIVDAASIVQVSDINTTDRIHLIQSGYLKVRDGFVAQIG